MDLNLNDVFKFRIGDKVQFAGTTAMRERQRSRLHFGLAVGLSHAVVVERLLQDCPGGIQKKYCLLFVASDGNGQLLSEQTIVEEGLEPWTPAPFADDGSKKKE